ncbi:MAG: threonine-phosphate decarboxylase CobD [Motiliproteus sp.]
MDDKWVHQQHATEAALGQRVEPLLRVEHQCHQALPHGGNLEAAELRFGKPDQGWLDLSTGISPWSFPFSEVPESHWQRLPHTEKTLESAAANYYQTDNPLAIPGSQFAIQRLPGLFRRCRVALPRWGYNEHFAAWEAAGHQPLRYDDSDPDRLEQQINQGEVDVVLVINPNNPSGQLIPQQRLRRWHQTLAAQGGYLIVDEAFMDASPEQSLTPLGPQKGLIVLRSVGKFFGLAGIRLGFLMATEEIRAAIAKERGPWAIPGPSAWVGCQALAATSWQAQQRQRLHGEANKLNQLLRRHLHTHASRLVQTAYFTTLFLPPAPAQAIYQTLGQQGLLIRFFEPQQGLCGLRFGLPATANQWRRLTESLERLNR